MGHYLAGRRSRSHSPTLYVFEEYRHAAVLIKKAAVLS